jgi:phospholipase/carboxylesterase
MWSNQPPLTKIGSLDVLLFEPQQKSDITVVMFHGYGADAYDLSSLKDETRMAKAARWVFPQGPKSVEIGSGFWGRAWFPIDMVAHERALTRGEVVSYAERRPPGINEARDMSLSFLKKLDVQPQNLIIGGFSQGAMLALDVALTLPVAPKGLVLLSGTLADKAYVEVAAQKFKGMRFFQSHGESDQILPFSGAERLRETLVQAGWNDVWVPFSGGHEISRQVIQELTRYLHS